MRLQAISYSAVLIVITYMIPLNSSVHAVVMEWVTIGDPGNAADTRYDATGYGGVSYVYIIGKYEVTNGQYIEFLNAVAASDPNGLYSTGMAGTYGGIERTGSPGSYTYGPKGGDANWLNRPVNYVDWYDTLRFANWMHNGQPTGTQSVSTTEDGAYDMSLGSSVVRKPGAQVFLPSEDEWYKSAYYKGGGANAGYWDYPTQQSNTTPTAELPPGTDLVNGSANHNWGGFVDSTYYTTEVGAYTAKPSDSAYGTFDQGGNVLEWTEALVGSVRVLRGGSYYDGGNMHASWRDDFDGYPTYEYLTVGFRVARVLGCFGGGDSDGDGVPDASDNCPCYYNPDQTYNRADLDQDCDVDVFDFLTFSNCFNGSLNPPNCP